MDAVVAQFGGAPIPKPMPVVGKDVRPERLFGSGSLPQRIVEVIRNRRRFGVADGEAMIHVPTARKKDFAQLAATDGLDGINDPGPTATLAAQLHKTFVFLRCSDGQAAFMGVVAAGFFDIDMLASGASQNSG